MAIQLLDGSLIVEVEYDQADSDFPDNICLRIFESCPVDEKIMRAGETNLFLTAGQARQLAACLVKAASESKGGSQPAQAARPAAGGKESKNG